MSNFSYKDIYIEDGKRVLEINILPEKYCNFNCIFCPIGRSKNKIDTQKSFDEVESSLIELEKKIEDRSLRCYLKNSDGHLCIFLRKR